MATVCGCKCPLAGACCAVAGGLTIGMQYCNIMCRLSQYLNICSFTSCGHLHCQFDYGRYHSTWTTCIVKFSFFGKNPSGLFIHITWYHSNCLKTSKGAPSKGFSFLIFFPKNPKFYKICLQPLIFGPTIKCYTILESSCLPCRRAILVIELVASTNEK